MDREEIQALSKCEWFEYDALTWFSDKQVKSYARRIRGQFEKQVSTWDDDIYTVWACRHFLAVKCLLYADLLLNSAKYAADQNLLVTVPYLLYYAAFSVGRAFALTVPEREWGQGKLYSIDHAKVPEVIKIALSPLCPKAAEEIVSFLGRLRNDREIVSYRFPIEGMKAVGQDGEIDCDDVFKVMKLIVECAELNSELLTATIASSGKTFTPRHELFYDTVEFEAVRGQLDKDDFIAISYFFRNIKSLSPLLIMTNFGTYDDFKIAWCDGELLEGNPNAFNPDTAYGPQWWTHF